MWFLLYNESGYSQEQLIGPFSSEDRANAFAEKYIADICDNWETIQPMGSREYRRIVLENKIDSQDLIDTCDRIMKERAKDA